ncbi:hypothetical protein Hanom_Chr16g01431401 [Helianthus anomalus]
MDLAVWVGWKYVFESPGVSFWKKLHVLYAYFFVRKIIAHCITIFIV